MCGIIGYTGKREAKEVLLSGLSALEYRGYDSAGITVFDENNRFYTVKSAGKIRALKEKLDNSTPPGASTGIGHTRWATHGAPTDYNSHPHGAGRVMLVHNGIIENYAELKSELLSLGYTFRSETDTEVAAVLLDSLYKGDPISAIKAVCERLSGSYAFGILFLDKPNTVYAVREGSPLIIGVGEGESFIASDITAILGYTKRYITLDEGKIAEICGESIRIFGKSCKEASYRVDTAEWDVHAAERGGFDHFMKKEIFEEPKVIRGCVSPRIKNALPDFAAEGLNENMLLGAERIVLVACGTAMHAAFMAKMYFEKYARIRTEVEIASEFRYRDPIITEKEVVIVVSQSGETADTIAALRLAKEKGAYTVGVVNTVGSTIAREVDTVLYIHAGPEIAVASTKAYTVQSTLFLLFSLYLARVRGTLAPEEIQRLCAVVSTELPLAIEAVLHREEEIKERAEAIKEKEHLFFIGRGADYYAALEASLKLKEISYIHSEAYAAGELKHGTISLIEEGTPVVALATSEALEKKLCSNAKEVTARAGDVFAIALYGSRAFDGVTDKVFHLPKADEAIAPIIAVTVLQLYAYFAAVARGCSVDQPRNLAKSVTVE